MTDSLPLLADTPLSDALDALLTVPADATEAELVDQLTLLESFKCAAEAAQAEAAVRLDARARERQRAAGVRDEQIGAGVASQIALARSVSPNRGAHLLGLARALAVEMPHTLELMKAGVLSEWRAGIVKRETRDLDPRHRQYIDEQLCAPRPDGATPTAVKMGDRELAAAAHKLACELDPAAIVARAAKAQRDRRVGIRPAPDTMTWFSALLGVKEGVAVYAALHQAAVSARTAGDQRTEAQIMADTLVDRVTGRVPAEPAKVEIKLVMTDQALTEDGAEAAHVPGYGPVPAAWAREQLKDAEVFIKRLYTNPTGQLVAMESKSRKAPPGLAEFITTRDQDICRNPHCNAPIRHIDHAKRWADGGATSAANLQGLCAMCNLAKEAEGWQTRPQPDGSVKTITPTGHVYTSPPPEPWGQRPTPARSTVGVYRVELAFAA